MAVRNNVERSRYELYVDDDLVGIADYRIDGDLVVFPHTEVRHDMQGRGFGAQLVQAALDDVRTEGRRVVPRCWYVAEFVENHPEYTDLLAA
ncbi:MAG TPA: GNAT family N-acetyltransferase [Acidimicrobiales bacterium]|nr:GNAT family N-acetyltransferase [Acidimicrobiales bacterium]